MNTIKAVLVGVALAVAGWLGWHFGSGELKQAREELARLDKAGQQALAVQAQAQDKLKADLAALSRQNEERLAEMNKTFDAQKQGLSADLNDARKRLAATASSRKGVETELATVRKQLADLPAGASPEREKLIVTETKLVEVERKLDITTQSLQCLEIPVPDNMLARLDVAVRP